MLQNKNITDCFKIYLLYIICLGSLSSQTYNISGRVLNSETILPIYNVNIFIKNTNTGTTTDSEGNFNLLLNEQLNQNSELIIKMIGYQEYIVPLHTTKNKTNTCQ